jgi:predicted amidohydrolase YtcJ
MNGFASLAAAGVPLAFGSDSPVTPFDPWAAVRAATLHPDVPERLDVRAAFHAHTVGGRRAARDDDHDGVLVAGAPADLAVWDGGPDPLTADLPPVDASTTGDLPTCVLTLVRGAPAHDREGMLS